MQVQKSVTSPAGGPADTRGRIADTRARILAAALDLFVAHGYQRTTLRQIADRLGLTKTAVLYHFPAKDRIIAALGEPLVADLEAVVDRAVGEEPGAARRLIVEGMLDAYLAHRQALSMARHDLSFLAQQPIYERLLRVVERALDVVAGEDADLHRRVRAMQALSMLGDPVLFFPGIDAQTLRPLVLSGAWRLLEADEPPAGTSPVAPDQADRPAGRRAGRPRALRGETLAEARRMYDERTHTVAEMATVLGVSRATLYRHLGAASRGR